MQAFRYLRLNVIFARFHRTVPESDSVPTINLARELALCGVDCGEPKPGRASFRQIGHLVVLNQLNLVRHAELALNPT